MIESPRIQEHLGRQGKKCRRINTPSQTTGIIELL